MNTPKYVAQLKHVREVSLVGEADLAWWTERLREERLIPTAIAGKAQVTISGIASRFMGIAFRELIVAVFVTPAAGSDRREGAFLLQAFNSSRLLAWSERTFFSTPYVHARVDVATGPPAALDVRAARQSLLNAKLGGGSDQGPGTLHNRNELWEGPIYLPSLPTTAPAKRQVFFARLGGFTRSYAFDPARDLLTVSSSATAPVLQMLLDSGFTATQWSIREDAQHARSKTYRRSAADKP